MLAPIVMGTIGQQQGTRSFDAGGIANLLASQKDNIAAALPAGFSNLLGGTGLLDSLGGAARTATAAHPASGDRRPAHLLLCQTRGASGPAGRDRRAGSDGRRARRRQAGYR